MRRSVSAVGLAICLSTAPLVAQPRGEQGAEAGTEEAQAEARRLKSQGDDDMVALRYDDALTAYEQSYRLVAAPALLYNRGRALQALGRFPEALELLEQFQRDAPEEIRARVPKLHELIATVRARVAHVTVRANVRGARVMVRGKQVGTTPLAGPIATNSGNATIELFADGYFPYRESLELPGDGSVQVEATLAARDTRSLLVIRSPVPGARVAVDGKAAGAVPAEIVVTPGSHHIRLTASGYEASDVTTVAKKSERKVVTVELVAERPLTAHWWFWTGVGAVVVTGVVVTVALLTEREPGSGDIPPGRLGAPLLHF